jgi:hypothetical protein
MAKRVKPYLPIDKHDSIEMQRKVLRAAGLQPERIADLVMKSVKELEEQLEAETSIAFRGDDGPQVFKRPDNVNRIAAAKALLDLSLRITDVKAPSSATQPGKQQIEISINLPDQKKVEVKDVTPSVAPPD